jgi:hypothetical protein
MNNIELLTSELPNIGEPTKNMINQGLWYLFKIDHPKAVYMLIADGVAYFLSNDGTVLFSEPEQPKNIQITESVYFKNLPFPLSLSNIRYA